MSVVLTGDVHQAIGNADQSYTEESEARLAVEYASIAARHGLKVTLFVTGRAVIDSGAEMRQLCAMRHVEIGGHGWNAFQPRLWHGALRRLTGSPHGPAWLQRRMIARTCTTLARWAERPVQSWRNHAYRYDAATPGLLAAAGIRAWSDEVREDRVQPYNHPSGVTIVPINTTPDHEFLRHGGWPRESAAMQWGGPSYAPDAWCDRVCTQVERIVGAGGVATLLVHPLCMKILDDWATFERLCDFLTAFHSRHVHEVVTPPCTR